MRVTQVAATKKKQVEAKIYRLIQQKFLCFESVIMVVRQADMLYPCTKHSFFINIYDIQLALEFSFSTISGD